MIEGLQAYLAYKDSGVPWLGEVPEQWDVKRLKRLCSRYALYGANVVATSYTDSGVRFLRTTDITEDGNLKSEGVFLPKESVRDYMLEDDDLLISRSGTIGRSFLYDSRMHGPCAYVGYLVRFVLTSEVLPKYVFLFTKTQAFAGFLRVMAISSTIENVNGEKYANASLPLPSLAEQSAIIRFLDHADRRIRRYIRVKQKLLKLLEEQKQVMIHRAVTRGLDPKIRLKPTGVEWLGDIPEHWDVRRNSQIFAQRNQTGFGELPILEVSLKTGVRVRDFDNAVRKQVISDRDKYKRAKKGDIAYNMMRMWQGAVGVAPVDGLVSPAYVVARPLADVDVRFFSTLFRTAAYMAEVDNCSRGIVKDRNRLYWEDFKQIHSPYPPKEEQKRIADAIDKITQGIHFTMDRMNREISLLREYRTRLIADVVTGKLDVREATAKLPDEVEAPEVADDSDVSTEDVLEEDLEAVPEEGEEVGEVA